MENILQLRSGPADKLDPHYFLLKLTKIEKSISDHFRKIDLKKIKLSTQDTLYLIDPTDIIRCESQGNYCKVYTTGQAPILISKTLKYISELLPNEHFFKTHQSHLINSKSIQKVHKKDGLQIELEDGTLIPVSRNEKANVLNHLHNL